MTKFKFKKKYGQNFLRDDQTIDKIVSSINPTENDLIIEIGPGGGAITKKLKNYRAQLVAFEIDEDTKKYLLPLEDEKTEIVYSDFLEVDIFKFLQKYSYENLYIVGNLPYYITTPIIEHIIDSEIEHNGFTIMVQKEVAERFLATPGHREYGYMTVLLNYHYEIQKVTDVTREKFIPAPNVDSAVLKLTPKKRQEIDYPKFKRLLRDSFQFKRKTIGNNLKSRDRIKLETILKRHGFDLTNRAEELGLDVFLDLTSTL